MKNVHDFVDLVAQTWDKGLGFFVPIIFIAVVASVVAFIRDWLEKPSSVKFYELIMGDIKEK